MIELLRAAHEASRLLQQAQVAHCVIGGLAATYWGEVRTTTDIDLTVWSGFGREAATVDVLLTIFQPRIPEARSHALAHRVLLGVLPPDFNVDIGLGGFPYEEGVLARSRLVEPIPGLFLPLVSPEDLIIQKVFAGRGHDWRDVVSVIVRQRSHLDWAIVEEHLPPLLELLEQPDRYDQLIALRDAVNAAGDNFPLTPDDLKLLAEPDRPD